VNGTLSDTEYQDHRMVSLVSDESSRNGLNFAKTNVFEFFTAIRVDTVIDRGTVLANDIDSQLHKGAA
jgi:hypothetical protein